MKADAGATATPLQDRLHVGEAEFRILSRRDASLVLEKVRRGKRVERDKAFFMLPQMPGFPVEAVDLDIGNDHAHLLVGLALKGDASVLAYEAVAAVTTD